MPDPPTCLIRGRTPARVAPGDLLGFSHCGTQGVIINVGTLGCPCWGLSHVGMVLAHPVTGDPVLFESTMSYDLPCEITGKQTSGVQAHDIPLRVRTYPGRVWAYPLSTPLSAGESDELTEMAQELLGVDYDTVGAVRARFLGLGWLARLYRPEDQRALFCSEFCAGLWRSVGRLTTSNVSVFSPNGLHRRAVRDGITRRRVRVR